MQPMVFHPISSTTQGQVSNAENTYGAAQQNLQGAQQNVQNYQKGMQGGSEMYGQNLSGAESSMGYNPQEMMNAQKALANTQTTMANLPQAVNQMGNYSGATAGQVANNASQMGGNLQGLMSGQANTVGALGNVLGQAQAQAQGQTQAGQNTQSMQLQSLQGIMSTAADQYKTAQADKQQLEQLFQQQGQFNADEAQKYQQANAAMLGAQAAMKQAMGSYAQSMAQAQLLGTQNTAAQNAMAIGQQQQAQQNAARSQPAPNQAISNYKSPAPNVAGQLGNNFLGWQGGVPNILRNAFNTYF